jgi:hypothetical protein
MVNPTIGMEIGETYTFAQVDRSNYMHPMGFTYQAHAMGGMGGHHSGMTELEPSVVAPAMDMDMDHMDMGMDMGMDMAMALQRADGACVAGATCPAPMYFSGDEYLGVYSNIPEVKNVTSGEEDFGLDVYQSLFFRSVSDWARMDPFSIKLRFDDEDHTEDIFYFCHVSTVC